MKRWKCLAAAVMALGLTVGTTISAYAHVWEYDGGETYVSGVFSGKEQGPAVFIDTDGTVSWNFVSNGKAMGPSILYGGTSGSTMANLYFSNKMNGICASIKQDRTGTGAFFEDDERKKSVVVHNWIDSDKTVYYAREKTDLNDGKAIAVYPNKDIYIGDFKNGKRDGWGAYLYDSDKTVYMGEWSNNQKEGVGYTTYSVDSKYLYKAGVWTQGKCQSVAVYYMKDDGILIGQNKDGKVQGPAVKLEPDGTVNLMEYKNNNISNKNPKIYKDASGNSYIGTDGKSGSGLKVTKSGDVQIGSFKDGRLNGQGFSFRAESGKREEGTYKDGALTNGITIGADGSYYKGTFKGGVRQMYDKGLYKSFLYSKEGTFNDYLELDTGIYTIFHKDGSSTAEMYLDGKKK